MNFWNLLFLGKQNFYHKTNWFEALFAKVVGAGRKLIAKFLKIKGNTLVWNQLISQNYSFSYTSSGGSQSNAIERVNVIKGHKLCFVWLQSATLTSNSRNTADFLYNDGSSNQIIYENISNNHNLASGRHGWIFTAPTDNVNAWIELYYWVHTPSNNVTMSDFMLFDLTTMFGSGKEPSTVEEFTSLFPLPYYSYEQGKLLSFNGSGIKTVGFNLFDQETVMPSLGFTKESDGSFYGVSGSSFSGKVVWANDLNTTEQICITFDYKYAEQSKQGLRFIAKYKDGTQDNVTVTNTTSYLNKSFVTTSGKVVDFITLSYGNGNVGTWFKNLCVNISSDKNGTYEPYTSSTTSIPTSTYFPTGMKSAGSVYDELTPNKVVTRIGSVDLGSLSWYYTSGGQGRFATGGIETLAKAVSTNSQIANIKCDKYLAISAGSVYSGNVGIAIDTNSSIWVYDTTYGTDNGAFKTAMNGVILYYELATPTEVDIDPPLNLSYQVWENGTEQLLPINTDNPTTSPILADIEYPDGERDDQYFTYRQYLPNSRMMSMALNTIMGRNVEFNEQALNILMKGE